ncbi:hypothetical protein BHE74_00040187 [Ensete ventricosum]|nr:hypothetical protein BHE74_00040187 [Ensete ventricosum]
MKKRDGHKLYDVAQEVKFRSVIRAPSRKFKILAICLPISPWEVVRAWFREKM